DVGSLHPMRGVGHRTWSGTCTQDPLGIRARVSRSATRTGLSSQTIWRPTTLGNPQGRALELVVAKWIHPRFAAIQTNVMPVLGQRAAGLRVRTPATMSVMAVSTVPAMTGPRSPCENASGEAHGVTIGTTAI